MADYRDEAQREALHERVTTLQQELDGARNDLERAKGTHDERLEAVAADIRKAQQHLASLHDQLSALQKERAPQPAVASAPTATPASLEKKKQAMLFGVGALFLYGGGIVALLVGKSAPHPQPISLQVPSATIATTTASATVPAWRAVPKPPPAVPTDAAPDVLTVADEPKNAAPWSVELVLLEPGTDAAAK